MTKVDRSTFLHPPPSLPSFAALQVSLAGPERVRACSWGEVKRAAGIDRRTHKPARGGLFCTKIFGPIQGYACGCRTYARKRHLGTACPRCGAEVVSPKARRERFGHIELASPVAHAWFSKGASNRIGYVLDLDRADLDRVLDYEAYIVTDPKATSLARGEILSAEQYQRLLREYGQFTAGTGGEVVLELLERVDVHALAGSLREAMRGASSAYRRKRIARRLKIVEALRDGQNRPEWLMITALPVLPPGRRPRNLANGRLVVAPTRDIALGLYYATRERPLAKGRLPVPLGLAEAAPEAARLACQVRVRSTSELVDVSVGPSAWAEAVRSLLAGDFVAGLTAGEGVLERENEAASGRGGRPAVAEPTRLGLAEAARQGRSFVDRAPTWREAIDRLAEASLGGKRAGLHGVKERAVAGRARPGSASLPVVKARRHSP